MKEFLDRVVRRETHSSRAKLSAVAAVVVILLSVYGLLEAMLRVVGQPPLLMDPLSVARAASALPAGLPVGVLAAVGVAAALIGLLFLANALLPGRRARHVIPDDRLAVVVQDEVVASALARQARMAAGVSAEQVTVVVARTTVEIRVRPTSGVPVEREAVRQAVADELEAMALVPAPVVRVQVSAAGAVGA